MPPSARAEPEIHRQCDQELPHLAPEPDVGHWCSFDCWIRHQLAAPRSPACPQRRGVASWLSMPNISRAEAHPDHHCSGGEERGGASELFDIMDKRCSGTGVYVDGPRWQWQQCSWTPPRATTASSIRLSTAGSLLTYLRSESGHRQQRIATQQSVE